MALPLSGQLCMSSIRSELGIPSQSPFCLDTAENGGYVALNICSPYLPTNGDPANISEWYGYCHTCPCGYYFCLGYSSVSCTDACNSYVICNNILS